MKHYSILLTALFVLTPFHNSIANVIKSGQDYETTQLVKFLISDKILVKGKSSQLVPLSYYIGTSDDIAIYFGDYICAKDNTCDVTDSLYLKPFAILGKGLPPEQQGSSLDKLQAQAQIERTDMKYGADIYDAATWQIALGLAANKGYLDPDEARKLISNQLENISHPANRATAEMFKYGYQNPVTTAKNAFTFRMIATDFFNRDPFADGKYQSRLHWNYDPEKLSKDDPDHHPADFFKYVSTWSDWKPITGENAWAQLIGPLQAEYLANNGRISDAALKNAIHSLKAFSAMQAGVGAFYYAPGGSDGNQGPIPQGEISLENNFSVLGGLQILKHILSEMTPTPKTTKALSMINVMLYGGTTVNGYQTIGLLSFLYNGAYNEKKGVFYTHGIASDPRAQNGWKPDTSEDAGATAVDVNTWGMSALGVETIVQWFGTEAPLKIWSNIRNQGGYIVNDDLWGVGYTLNNQQEKIMSTEWTAGAINAVNSLIDFYDKKIDTSTLKNDLRTMKAGITHLRNDQYLNFDFDHATPKQYFVKVNEADGYAYLYASKRYAIPFGWNANTLPSTTSNAWVIMNKFDFNPFQYQGKLAGENYPKPAKLNIMEETPSLGDALPDAVKVDFTSGNLDSNGLKNVALAYSLTGPDGGWKTAATIGPKDQFKGTATLPKGTKAVSIAFNTTGWFGACKIAPATKICKDQTCKSVKLIAAKWSIDGRGECELK